MAAATGKERIHTYLVLKIAGAERIIVWDSQDVTVGRAAENDLSIDDAALSRRHAEFYRAGNAFAVKDLGTSNGTTVNGATIREHSLQNKDVVRLGDAEISFVQTQKNPAQIGRKVEFASQLKSFGGAAGQAKSGEATMLGLVQTVGDEEEEDFVVGKMNDFGQDLVEMSTAPAKRPAPRDLDLELGAMGGDELPHPAANSAPISPAHRIPAPSKPGPRLAPPSSPDWALDDAPEPPPVARPQPQPRQPVRAAAPTPAPAPAPARRAAAPAKQTLSLQLEIEGLSGELRSQLEALLGKVIELPQLRIRVKSEDL